MSEVIALSEELLETLPFATILIKRGDGVPTSDDLQDGELGFSRGKKTLYIKDGEYAKQGGTMVPESDRDEGKDYAGIVPIGSFSGGGGGGTPTFVLDTTVSISGMAPDAAAVRALLGDLDKLETNEKTSLVAAINDAFNNAQIDLDSNLDAETSTGKAADAGAVGSALENLKQELLKEIYYAPITINEFSVTPSQAENGDPSIVSVRFNWSLSKVPATLKIGNTEITTLTQTGQLVVPGQVTENTKWILVATDEKEAEVKDEATLKFYNAYFCGSIIEPAEYNSDFILSLGKTELTDDGKKYVGNSYIKNFSYNTGEEHANRYIYYCCPANSGTYSFAQGPLPFSMERLEEPVAFVNEYGYGPTNYWVFRSTYPDLGSGSVEVIRK